MSVFLVAAAVLLPTTGGAAVATSVTGAAQVALAPAGPDGSYVPLPATRLLDTRTGSSGPFQGSFDPGRTSYFSFGESAASSRRGTVFLNVTITNARAPGFVTVWSDGARPATSSLNFMPGRTVAGLVAVTDPGSGSVASIYNGSAGRADVIIDLEGYSDGDSAQDSGRFSPVPPSRLFDSRSTAAVPARRSVAIVAAGRAQVPTSGAGAVLVDVIAVAPKASGYLSAFAGASSPPATSTLNFAAGRTVSNVAVVPIGSDGRIDVFNGGFAATNVVVDVLGYLVSGAPTTAGSTGVLHPARLLDTRSGLGAPKTAVSSSHTVVLHVAGRGGVPTSGVATVALNIVATSTTGPGYLVVHPGNTPVTGTSSLNFGISDTVANLVIAPVAADGTVDISVAGGGAAQLVADVESYSLNPTTISGRVTDQSGHPASVEVTADDGGRLFENVFTDAAGRYLLGGVDGRTLTVCFSRTVTSAVDFPGSVASQCWHGAPYGTPSTPIAAGYGLNVTADAVMLPAGAVSGNVSNQAGLPVAVAAEIDLNGTPTYGGQFGKAGQYFVGGMSPGSYTVCLQAFGDSYSPPGYVPQCYGQGSGGTASLVAVAQGRISSNLDVVLNAAGGIKGSVDVAGLSQTTPGSYVVTLTGQSQTQTLHSVSLDGSFQMLGVTPGSYTMCVQPDRPNISSGCYGGATPTSITVAARTISSNIDVHLSGAASLHGTVRSAAGPVAGATVTATATGAGTSFTATTASTGFYALRQLPPGIYTLCFHADGLTDQCYNGAPDPASATPVTLGSGSITAISATLS